MEVGNDTNCVVSVATRRGVCDKNRRKVESATDDRGLRSTVGIATVLQAGRFGI